LSCTIISKPPRGVSRPYVYKDGHLVVNETVSKACGYYACNCNCLCAQNYIARFGHGSAKLARQAKSKEKTLKRMVDGGLTARVATDKVPVIHR